MVGGRDGVHEFRFDRHPNADRSVEANARPRRDRFVEACENRVAVAIENVDFDVPIDRFAYRVTRAGYEWRSERPALEDHVSTTNGN